MDVSTRLETAGKPPGVGFSIRLLQGPLKIKKDLLPVIKRDRWAISGEVCMRFQNASRGVVSSFAAIVVLVASFFVPALLHAQAAGATLSGNVTDPSSATIPNANVSIKNIETGISRDVTTNEAGFYNAPHLQDFPSLCKPTLR